jgi:hypothetical protein
MIHLEASRLRQWPISDKAVVTGGRRGKVIGARSALSACLAEKAANDWH